MKVELWNYTWIDNYQLCLQKVGNICTRLSILKKKMRRKKRKFAYKSYVWEQDKKGVMPFIENSNVHIYIYCCLTLLIEEATAEYILLSS